MKVNSSVTRRVHIYLGVSERFVLEGVPLLQKSDAKRRASIRQIEVIANHNENGYLIYSVMARGQAVNRNGTSGSGDRTFKFTGLDSFPSDIKMEIEALFRRQYILNNLNEEYEVPRENGPTATPVLEVLP